MQRRSNGVTVQSELEALHSIGRTYEPYLPSGSRLGASSVVERRVVIRYVVGKVRWVGRE